MSGIDLSDYDGSLPLGNGRWEKFAQNVANGMSFASAYAWPGSKQQRGTRWTRMQATGEETGGRPPHCLVENSQRVRGAADQGRKNQCLGRHHQNRERQRQVAGNDFALSNDG